MFDWDYWILLAVVAIAGEINNRRIYSKIEKLEKSLENHVSSL